MHIFLIYEHLVFAMLIAKCSMECDLEIKENDARNSRMMTETVDFYANELQGTLKFVFSNNDLLYPKKNDEATMALEIDSLRAKNHQILR